MHVPVQLHHNDVKHPQYFDRLNRNLVTWATANVYHNIFTALRRTSTVTSLIISTSTRHAKGNGTDIVDSPLN